MFTKKVNSQTGTEPRLKKGRRGRPAGTTSQGQEMRERLYETAIRLISKHGYESTTLRTVAESTSPGLRIRNRESGETDLYSR
jgi:hypothetical protein